MAPILQTIERSLAASPIREHRSCIVWCLVDGKPGHENQVRGLVRALSERCDIDCHWIRIERDQRQWWNRLRGKFPQGAGLPRPDFILGAGHRTHPAMLAARQAHGGQAIVLMKPTWSIDSFDLCLIPEHDGVAPRKNVVMTQGVINTITPSSDQHDHCGLLLVGGPSKHHHWNDEAVARQIEILVHESFDVDWTLSTSRRTPASFVALLKSWGLPHLEIVPFEETTPSWVPRHLASAGRVWVSEDSISMVYEAVTSGAHVGLLETGRRRDGRVVRGVEQLRAEGRVTSFSHWQATGNMNSPSGTLNEADRCAEVIYTSWQANRTTADAAI